MANSRKSPSLNKDASAPAAFERALGTLLARVSVCAPGIQPSIAVAYSGGLDSSLLLHLVSQYAAPRGIPVRAFHIHHGLSPNADVWVAHCQAEAARCGFAFSAARVAVDSNDKRGLEEAARIARYNALGDLCRQFGVPLLLTAHHQDDQAETVLLQLMRGAGLPGLSGMAAFQARHDLLGAGVALGRPLLAISRSALEHAVVQLGLRHIGDESNADIRFRRNALRNQISPVIETHFPGFAPQVARAAMHAQSAQTLLHDLAMIDLAQCRADPQDAALDLSRMRLLSAERVDNLLRHWLYQHKVQMPSTARLDEIRAQMLGGASDMHPFFDFGTVTLHRIANRLELHPNLGTPPEEVLALQWQGESGIDVPQWHGRLVFDSTAGPGLDAGVLRSTPLMLAPRSGQERLKIAVNRPSKSLKSLFQESEIASWQRQWLPLAYLKTELVFVAGLGMDVRHLTPGIGITLRWVR
ncbi:MAG: tRNA lysidine(34) synthetase TilS [Pseudomonadota bacterium]